MFSYFYATVAQPGTAQAWNNRLRSVDAQSATFASRSPARSLREHLVEESLFPSGYPGSNPGGGVFYIAQCCLLNLESFKYSQTQYYSNANYTNKANKRISK